MWKLSLAVAAAAVVALATWHPASAQQCPKGQTWDQSTYSCK